MKAFHRRKEKKRNKKRRRRRKFKTEKQDNDDGDDGYSPEQNLFSSSSEMLKTKSSSLNFLSGIQYNAPALFASGKYLFTAATAKNQRRRKKNQRQVQIRLKVRRKQYEESCWPGKRRSRRSGETSSVDVVAKKLVLVHKNPNPRSSTLRETKSVVQGERERRECFNALVLCEV